MEILAGDWRGKYASISGLTEPPQITLFHGMIKHDIISFTEIAQFEVITEENKKSIAGTLGWGAVGAVALGPLGLLAGVLGGGNKKVRVIAITFNDGRKVLLKGTQKDVEQMTKFRFNQSLAAPVELPHAIKTEPEPEPEVPSNREPAIDRAIQRNDLVGDFGNRGGGSEPVFGRRRS